MPWGAIAGSLVSGLFGSSSASKAASAQERAAQEASEIQYKMWKEQQEAQEPWRMAGLSTLPKLMKYTGVNAPTGMIPSLEAIGADYRRYYDPAMLSGYEAEKAALEASQADSARTGGLVLGNMTLADLLGSENPYESYKQAFFDDISRQREGTYGRGIDQNRLGTSAYYTDRVRGEFGTPQQWNTLANLERTYRRPSRDELLMFGDQARPQYQW